MIVRSSAVASKAPRRCTRNVSPSCIDLEQDFAERVVGPRAAGANRVIALAQGGEQVAHRLQRTDDVFARAGKRKPSAQVRDDKGERPTQPWRCNRQTKEEPARRGSPGRPRLTSARSAVFHGKARAGVCARISWNTRWGISGTSCWLVDAGRRQCRLDERIARILHADRPATALRNSLRGHNAGDAGKRRSGSGLTTSAALRALPSMPGERFLDQERLHFLEAHLLEARGAVRNGR